MLNFIGHERNINLNYFEIAPHSSQNCYKLNKQQKMLVRVWGEKENFYTVVGNVN
jgi:hypothetical protein